MTFSEAFAKIRDGENAMRLPTWGDDVKIKTQVPEEHSKMTHPYLYVESRFGRVPWKETYVELFSTEWEVISD